MSEATAPTEWPQPYQLLDAAPYWAALDEQRLTYQRCADCAEAVWPAHSSCPYCSSAALAWAESAGRGTVYSFSTVMRGPTPVWASITPYTVGFVQMAEGYVLFAQIEGEPESIAIDQDVTVRFVERGAQTIPVFTATSPG
ncbi:Zn-ribbon domain-containing OB-fold protein [Nocardia sp. NPDC058379]|uniref:Zn-ribbon domain-containing OB-fold protein n=1 Tax=unclassified Nocardia TaxID=2637762 RepID=UPI00364EED4B